MAADGESSGIRRGPAEATDLDEISTGIAGILDAVDLPIIVVCSDCKLTRFNRAATTVLRLTASDIGRSPGGILPAVENLDAWCAQVIADGAPCRRETRDRDRHFLIRIAPYHGSDLRVMGAVLTFTNVTAFRASLDQAIYEREYTKAILNTVSEPLVVLDSHLRVQTANRAFYATFQLSRDETQGVPLYDLGDSEWQPSSFWESLKATLSENTEFQPVEIERDFPGIGRRTVLLDARRLSREGDAMLLLALHDITDRKRAQESVRQRTAQFQTLLNEAPLGVYLVDGDFRIREANPTALQVFGEIPDLIGRDFGEVIHIIWPKDAADEVAGVFRHTLETGEPYFVPERSAQRLDLGDREYYEWQISRIPLPEKRYGVVCYFRDISRQVFAREAIAASEQRFRTLVSVITDVPWTTNAEGRFVEPQPAWTAYTGQTWEQLRDFGWADAIHETDRQRIVETWERACKSRNLYQAQGRFWHAATQTYRYLDARATPVLRPDGTVREWVGTCTDVDERKGFENALRQSEERLRFMAESMPQKIFTTTAAGGVDYVNRQWMNFTGLPFEQIKDWGWTGSIHPDDLKETLDRWEHSRATGEPFQCVHRFRRADGAWRWHLSCALAMRDAAGQISMWIGSNTDINDQKEAEEHLRQTQKLESLGILAGGIAHDFNNLLVGILGNASLALDGLDQPASAIQPLLKSVIVASERAAALTQQMLAYSGKGKFVIMRINVSELIRSVVTLLQSSISRAVELKLDLTDDPLLIQGDESQIHQVIMNLVINGAEAIEKCGTVTVRTRAQNLSASDIRALGSDVAIAPGPYVCVDVADTGSGMGDATIARIFDPFFTTKFTCRGLGLAAVSGIIRGHNGLIRVSSELGKGTTFKVLLPAYGKAGSKEKSTNGESRLPGTAAGTVLVVDDEEIVRRTAKAALEKREFTVLLAENGIEAVKIFEQSAANIDVVLLDLTMPLMSGEQTLVELTKIKADVEVILSSGFSEIEAVRGFKGRHLAGFLQKPYTAAALAQKVRLVLESRRRSDRMKNSETAS